MSTNGYYVFEFEGQEYRFWVRQLVDNMMAVFPEMRPRKLRKALPHKPNHCSVPAEHTSGDDGVCGWEPSSSRRLRVEEIVAKRWGVSPTSIVPWLSNTARPGPNQRQFLADLKKYGRVRFSGGKVVPSSLNKGPDYSEFHATTPPRDVMREFRAEQRSAVVAASANP